LLLHGNNGYANAPRSYVSRTLPVLLNFGVGGACSFDCLQSVRKCKMCPWTAYRDSKSSRIFWRSRWPSASKQFV